VVGGLIHVKAETSYADAGHTRAAVPDALSNDGGLGFYWRTNDYTCYLTIYRGLDSGSTPTGSFSGFVIGI
jgi:hypothetical protein